MTETDAETGRHVGLLASLRRLASTLIEILQTRIEIIANEFEDERARLRDVVVFGVLALFFVSTGITLATVFVVAVYWETHRLAVLGSVALLYLGIGGMAGIVLYRRIRPRHRLFATTLSELSKDRDQLAPRP